MAMDIVTFAHVFLHCSFSVGLVGITSHFMQLVGTLKKSPTELEKQYTSSKTGTVVSFACITGVLLTEWHYYAHFPLTDLYESLLFLSWSFLLLQIFVAFSDPLKYRSVYFPQPKKSKKVCSLIVLSGLFIQGFATFTQGFATWGLLRKMDQSTILVPALQSLWLIMHVTLTVLAYAALLSGSLVAVAIVVIDERKRIDHFLKRLSRASFFIMDKFGLWEPVLRIYIDFHIKYIILYRLILYRFFIFPVEQLVKEVDQIVKEFEGLDQSDKRKLKSDPDELDRYMQNSINDLDKWSYGMIRFGFAFLTIGILSGAVWANESWGSYWNWDPKEIWALIAWIIFATYLHLRTLPMMLPQMAAKIASLGFVIIWISYFGVNIFGMGFHNYGSF